MEVDVQTAISIGFIVVAPTFLTRKSELLFPFPSYTISDAPERRSNEAIKVSAKSERGR